MSKIVKIYGDTPCDKSLQSICKVLRTGGVIIYPTDSYYAYGCAVSSVKAIANLKNIKGKQGNNLSLVCSSISMASQYAKIDNRMFAILRENTPGEFTFILSPSSLAPSKFMETKNSVGIRIPSSPIAVAIAEALGEPLASTSITMDMLDAEDRGSCSLIFDECAKRVDLMVDGGDLDVAPTTVIDLREGSDPLVVRQGRGDLIF